MHVKAPFLHLPTSQEFHRAHSRQAYKDDGRPSIAARARMATFGADRTYSQWNPVLPGIGEDVGPDACATLHIAKAMYGVAKKDAWCEVFPPWLDRDNLHTRCLVLVTPHCMVSQPISDAVVAAANPSEQPNSGGGRGERKRQRAAGTALVGEAMAMSGRGNSGRKSRLPESECQTPAHFEYGGALNGLVALREDGIARNVCARWFFIVPWHHKEVMAAMCSELRVQRSHYLHADHRHLPLQCWIDLCARFKEGVVQIEQRHGDVVIVPEGWMHAVFNLRFNAKVAMESCTMRGIPAAVWARTQVRSMCDGYTLNSRTVPPREYMWIGPAIDVVMQK